MYYAGERFSHRGEVNCKAGAANPEVTKLYWIEGNDPVPEAAGPNEVTAFKGHLQIPVSGYKLGAKFFCRVGNGERNLRKALKFEEGLNSIIDDRKKNLILH